MNTSILVGMEEVRPAASSDPAGVTVLYWLLRLGLGALILATGVGKVLDLPGFVGVLQTCRFGLDDAVLQLIAPTISAVEIARGLDLEEFRRRHDARFVNRFEEVPEGTRYIVAADIRPKGWWKLLAGPWLGAWVRHRLRRDVLEPVRRFAEAGGAATGLPTDD